MAFYAGIDASLETVNICIVDEEGSVLLERKIEAEPDAIIGLLRSFGRSVERVGLEAGPTASWLYTELRTAGMPAICLECRHVKAGLSAMRNKTGRNDARGIAQLVRLGWFRQVSVKSDEAQRIRMLLVSRTHLPNKSHDLENTIRGSLKVFGLRIGAVARRAFEARVMDLTKGDISLRVIVEPLLRVRRAMLEEFERLDRLRRRLAARDPVCRRLMTVPGVGVVVALTYRTGVDAPERFSRSRDVGAHFGLTPRRYSSGQTEYDGRISRSGDETVRTALYQAAHVLMHHGRSSSLRSWAMRIAKRRSPKAAKVTLARKLAVVMHRMWVDGADFRWSDNEPASAAQAPATTEQSLLRFPESAVPAVRRAPEGAGVGRARIVGCDGRPACRSRGRARPSGPSQPILSAGARQAPSTKRSLNPPGRDQRRDEDEKDVDEPCPPKETTDAPG